MFRVALNKTSTIQSFLNSNLNPITAYPNEVIDTTFIQGSQSDALTPIDSFLNYLKTKKIKRFHITRTYALGDILILVPIIRYLRASGFDPYLITTPWMLEPLEALEIEARVSRSGSLPFPEGETGIILNWIVEQDHIRKVLSETHRVDIYFKVLGIDKIPKKLDWSMNVKNFPKRLIPEKYIVFQSRGTTNKKQLPIETENFLIRKMEEKGVKVIHIGEGSGLSIKELFSVIKYSECLLCMDSSPLWISHFTETPTITLFGPTRKSERLTYHPLYPKAAIGIALNEEIDCEACFELTDRCNDAISCLQVKPERVFELIEPYINNFIL